MVEGVISYGKKVRVETLQDFFSGSTVTCFLNDLPGHPLVTEQLDDSPLFSV